MIPGVAAACRPTVTANWVDTLDFGNVSFPVACSRPTLCHVSDVRWNAAGLVRYGECRPHALLHA